MIKTSHEAPLSYLELLSEFNDYFYVLPHLLSEEPLYTSFVLEQKRKGVHIMMDNSVHELGKPLEWNDLSHWLEIIQPQEFFVPDVLGDFNATFNNANIYFNKIKNNFPNCKPIAVLQGNSINDFVTLTNYFISMGYKKIALPYACSFYADIHPLSTSIYVNKAIGRYFVFDKIIKHITTVLKLTPHEVKFHLLGVNLPQEIKMYEQYYEFIGSLDTSNPVMAALDGIYYDNTGIQNIKPLSNMNTHFYVEYDKGISDIIRHNVKMFKKINQ